MPPSTSEPLTVAAAPSEVRDAVPASRCGGVRSQVVANCVIGWLKDEIQEFRDGAKREIGEFRAGFATVRRVLRQFGSKIHNSQ